VGAQHEPGTYHWRSAVGPRDWRYTLGRRYARGIRSGHADALHRSRTRSFGVVITSCDSAVDEDLALLTEMRAIRPGVKCIVLARRSTPAEVIAALRARVFACFTPPFDRDEIAHLAAGAASDNQWRDDIQVLSARPGWVSVRVNCPHHG
jgi:DNA-binding NtrC family response regulator